MEVVWVIAREASRQRTCVKLISKSCSSNLAERPSKSSRLGNTPPNPFTTFLVAGGLVAGGLVAGKAALVSENDAGVNPVTIADTV